ncbi:NAD(P)H-dependent glycerol-3-phosphate dehydrogenase [Virgibacillus halodenitrificans]|uniref:NAD(P)H-dependent glycerol-3-phosphate dehydrogenase n=1 Tax=Virgibacillus halodenitrificans TaxID=1482 RepID=UPI001FB2FED8|nr:NAD(P)H-dependent glycerol-3-phosphate dehydrogenase [Virgibacillus halodenitrificans]MCJ0930995.1 NAD(P)H-dependent glycerol-3-phosphate dehydrogenase [Virgibacillus halodenitrificans]WHX27367.1 NAD(P)H-dependent glycerol-3-phosphate dehydrogenase [Virgibacillus halodenitrificans]
MQKVAVLGAGSWGTALSIVLADNGHDVRLWTHRQEQAELINKTHKNEKYLDVTIPKEINAYHDLKSAVKDVTAIVIVVPTKAIREVCKQLNEVLEQKVNIIHASKGIEPVSLKRVSEMISDELSQYDNEDIVVLSGPSHAEEVALRQPTTVTVSALNIELAKHAQDLFINEVFRVYTSPDIIGIELGGALKNIIALGAGISDGLGYGDNAKAALITRGLAEIARLGTTLGANPLSFLGLPGVGDLIVTCTSVHSRNWRAGNLLGKGNNLDDVLEQMGMVVEGVRTVKAAYQFANEQKVEMPITTGIYQVIFEDKDPRDVVDQLMNRTKREEMDDLAKLLMERYSQ